MKISIIGGIILALIALAYTPAHEMGSAAVIAAAALAALFPAGKWLFDKIKTESEAKA